jgi:hypothetical protein
MKLTGLQAASSPGFPPSVAGEIRARTEALAMELDKPGVIIEDWLPDPALAGDGQFADQLFSMLALAAEAPGPGSDEPGSGPLRDYLAAAGPARPVHGRLGPAPRSLRRVFHPGDADVRLTQSVNRTHWDSSRETVGRVRIRCW